MDTTASPPPAGHGQPKRHYRILIAGGGTGGLTVAARLCRRLRDPDIAIVEPSDEHYYQPLWTLVGAGVVAREHSRRAEGSLIPTPAVWIRDHVTEFAPVANEVVLGSGERLGYDHLVVAVGLQLDWDAVEGLAGSVGRDGICSNYAYDQCSRTWETIRSFGGGTAIFTNPKPPIKCAGAPQKIMYLADDHWRKAGVRQGSRIIYASGTPGIFSVKEFAATLDQVIARKGIETMYQHNLVRIDPSGHDATFQSLDTGEETTLHYDVIHVTPPQSAPAVVRSSPLADDGGWVKVDKHTCRHPDFPNVFSLGDASSLPTSKTGAAVRKEAPVLVDNLLAAIDGRTPTASYNGYSSCPLTTGYGKLVLAEFDYDLKPTPTFPLIDTTQERWDMYQLKRYCLPAMYWHGMMKGIA